ncbi:MAG: hypothetical protein KAS75_01200 [Planctomycetes bacterium]|nr:hypothetical protein [Planctomycetota bacterium]
MCKKTIILFCVSLLLYLSGNVSAEMICRYEFEDGYVNTGTGTVTGTPYGGANIVWDGWTKPDGYYSVGWVLNVTGSGDYVNFGSDDLLDIDESITVGAWIKNDGSNYSREIVSRGFDWRLFANGSEVAFQIGANSPVETSGSSLDGTWHHYAAVYDGAEIILYMDGNEVDSIACTGSIASGASMTVGARSGGSADFDGWIDDVRIYDNALSTEEIQNLYHWKGVNYYVDGMTGSDANDGLTPETAFETIQKGIDKAYDSDVVFVYPDVYTEALDFLGKAITVKSVNEPAVIEAGDDYAVSFYTGEDSDTVLNNFVITNSDLGIFAQATSPTISNVTVVDCNFGAECWAGADPNISNSVFWDNNDGDLFGCSTQYSLVQQNGNDDPLFADSNNGDYHLQSKRGRYWPEHDVWVLDDANSPGIDSGDLSADVGNEPMPHGSRINMGAYGGTSYASMTLSDSPLLEGDLNNDGIVNMLDFARMAANWLESVE